MSSAGRKLTIRMPDNRRLRDARIARLHTETWGRVSPGTPVLSLAVRDREHMVRAPRAGRVVPLVSPGDMVEGGDPLYVIHIDEAALVEETHERQAFTRTERPRRTERVVLKTTAPTAGEPSTHTDTAPDGLAAGWGKPVLAIALYLLACFAVLPLLRAFGHDADWPLLLAMVAGSAAFGLFIAYLYTPTSGFLARWFVRVVAVSWIGVSMFTIFGPTDMETDVPLASVGDPVPEPPASEVVILEAEKPGGLTIAEGAPEEAAQTPKVPQVEEGPSPDPAPLDEDRPAQAEATVEAVVESSAPAPLVTASKPASPTQTVPQVVMSGPIPGRALGPPIPVHEAPRSILASSPNAPPAHDVIVREWARHLLDDRARIVLRTPGSSAAPPKFAWLSDVSRPGDLRSLPGPADPVPQVLTAYALLRDRTEDWTHVLLDKDLVTPRPSSLPRVADSIDPRPYLAVLGDAGAPAPLRAAPDVTRVIAASAQQDVTLKIKVPEMIATPKVTGTFVPAGGSEIPTVPDAPKSIEAGEVPAPHGIEDAAAPVVAPDVAAASGAPDVDKTVGVPDKPAAVDAGETIETVEPPETATVASPPAKVILPANPKAEPRVGIARSDPAPQPQPTDAQPAEPVEKNRNARQEPRGDNWSRWKGPSSGGVLRGGISVERPRRDDSRFRKAPPPASKLTDAPVEVSPRP